MIVLLSADPGLCQGRGGAWDHRRCGTWLSGRKQRHTPSRQHLCQLHAPAIYMLLPNSYTYMPLPSVFQEVQDCRLPGLKPSKRFRRPPRQQLLQLLHAQQLLQLHAPAICFSGGSRLPFARPQTPQTLPTLPQASKATTLTATCPCHLFFRGLKTAVCPPQTPQTLPTLPQASKATTLTATTCPCHLFFRGFKTAVCPPSNPPNPSAGLQGNNSYSYMPLPSVFQGVQDCRLPALKPPKPFRRPPRQQLLQLLHAPAICFSGGSRLPFARPQTPQTLPQASKATTLTATCPCHLFFGGFKTAVCPPSNPPNASNPSAGLQGNNSYSYMPLPSVFQGVQDCRLPALKPPKPFRRPPRQQLFQLHAPAICFSGGSRLPFARPQTPQTLPQASKATTLTATCPCICFSGGSRLPFARPQTPQTLPTLPQASKATTLTATTCPCHLFFRGFKTAICPPSNPPNPSAGLQGNNSYSYMPLHLFFRGFKTAVCPPSNPPNASNPSAGLQGNNSYSYMPLPSVFQGVQDCRLPALKPPKPFRRPPRQQLLQLHAPAICFSGGSRFPFCPPSNPPNPSAGLQGNNSYSYMPLPSVFQGVQDCRLPAPNPPNASNPPAGLQGNNSYSYMPLPSVFPPSNPPNPSGFKTAVCTASNPPNASNPPAGLQGNNSYSYMPLPSVFQGVQDCRLPALKPPKPFRRPPRQQLLQLLHAPAIYFSGGSRLPFARPQTPQTLPTLPQASKATTLTATCPCHLFFRGFKTAVCPPSNPPNASNPPAGLQGNNSYSYMSLPSVFQGVQECRLPGLKPPKRFQPSRRPPRQQLLQLHAPAICFSGGSRLPFARPQTLQTLPQASKATTLTATCPCHLFFRGFKTAVCPASNPPNASAGLQGNNCYSYMPRETGMYTKNHTVHALFVDHVLQGMICDQLVWSVLRGFMRLLEIPIYRIQCWRLVNLLAMTIWTMWEMAQCLWVSS